jgi:hypothetical protein
MWSPKLGRIIGSFQPKIQPTLGGDTRTRCHHAYSARFGTLTCLPSGTPCDRRDNGKEDTEC